MPRFGRRFVEKEPWNMPEKYGNVIPHKKGNLRLPH